MPHTIKLPGLVKVVNCCLEGSIRNTNAVFLGQCDVWALVLYQYLSFSGREGLFTLHAVDGLRSCAATEYKLRANSVQIKTSCIRSPRKDRALGVFKTCCEGQVREDEINVDSYKFAATHIDK